MALYNDEGPASVWWTGVKKFYCSGSFGKAAVCSVHIPVFFLRMCALSAFRRRNMFKAYRSRRGMSVWHDWIDWLGGYPFEVAKVEDVLRMARAHGMTLVNLQTTNRRGNNQFVFSR